MRSHQMQTIYSAAIPLSVLGNYILTDNGPFQPKHVVSKLNIHNKHLSCEKQCFFRIIIITTVWIN